VPHRSPFLNCSVDTSLNNHTQVGPDVPTSFMNSSGVLEQFTVVYIKVRG
jgi:hypothetical protein